MVRQVHAYFTGRVQGVGFRFSVQDLAVKLGVFGWVKNLRDGRVEILAEADESALKDFLERVNQLFSRYIQGTDISWDKASGAFQDFKIDF